MQCKSKYVVERSILLHYGKRKRSLWTSAALCLTSNLGIIHFLSQSGVMKSSYSYHPEPDLLLITWHREMFFSPHKSDMFMEDSLECLSYWAWDNKDIFIFPIFLPRYPLAKISYPRSSLCGHDPTNSSLLNFLFLCFTSPYIILLWASSASDHDAWFWSPTVNLFSNNGQIKMWLLPSWVSVQLVHTINHIIDPSNYSD